MGTQMKQQRRDRRWQRFDSIKTKETGGTLKPLTDTFINLAIPAPYTHRGELEAIVRQFQPPLEIESLDEKLSEAEFVRAKTIFRLAADEIDDLAANYQQIVWWISEHGLNMATGPLESARIGQDTALLLFCRNSLSSKERNPGIST